MKRVFETKKNRFCRRSNTIRRVPVPSKSFLNHRKSLITPHPQRRPSHSPQLPSSSEPHPESSHIPVQAPLQDTRKPSLLPLRPSLPTTDPTGPGRETGRNVGLLAAVRLRLQRYPYIPSIEGT